MMLIGYHSNGAYKLYSPIEDKLVISKDGLVDESKGWDWSRSLVRQESDTVTIVFEKDNKMKLQPVEMNMMMLQPVKMKNHLCRMKEGR